MRLGLGLKECPTPRHSLSKVNLCNRLVNTRNSSIFASGSPRHVLGPGELERSFLNNTQHQ